MKRKHSFVNREDDTQSPRVRVHKPAPKRRRVDPGHSIAAPLPYPVPGLQSSDDPGGEIMITAVPSNTTETELQLVFEREFELPEYLQYSDGSIINFSIFIPVRSIRLQ